MTATRLTQRKLSILALVVGVSACGGADGVSDAADVTEAEPVDITEVMDGEGDTNALDDTTDLSDSETGEIAEVVQPRCSPGLRAGPKGTHRGELAEDFSLALVGGQTLSLATAFTGCESFVFIADGIPVSAVDPTSILASEADLAELLERSPDDVHYVFISTASAEDAATRSATLQARIDTLLAGLSTSVASHWRAHLHVVATRAQDLAVWPGGAISAHLAGGFAIDHAQRIRGLGNLADVTRYDQTLAAAEQWPWRNNLAYAAYEADYMRAEAARNETLQSDGARVIEVFTGEVLSQFALADVALPSAEDMASYDTLEVEITLRCPDPDQPEFSNCGAWDYLATLSFASLDSGDGTQLQEVARFITPYHREAHWVVDATPALALLAAAGSRQLRWDFAPEWNVQPTATWLSLRLSNHHKGTRPVATTLLFTGGDFGSSYNDRAPVVVDIPATTKRAEVWTLVTGHGAGPNQCAEFCGHSHIIGVGASEYFKGFTEAGDNDGCIAAITRGMTPNQAGTWWFGRGGWCPGAPVEPWVIDVSNDIIPSTAATFTYRGQLGGRDPPDGSGNIMLTSYLVLYE